MVVSKGNQTVNVGLVMPIASCGIRLQHKNGTFEVSVRLVLQMDDKLRQSLDMERVVRCTVPNQLMTMNISKRSKNR